MEEDLLKFVLDFFRNWNIIIVITIIERHRFGEGWTILLSTVRGRVDRYPHFIFKITCNDFQLGCLGKSSKSKVI